MKLRIIHYVIKIVCDMKGLWVFHTKGTINSYAAKVNKMGFNNERLDRTYCVSLNIDVLFKI